MPITDLIPWRRTERKAPVPLEEDHAVRPFQDQVDRWFDEVFRGFGLAPMGVFGERWDTFSPRVDVTDTGKEVEVAVELPGIDEKDIQVRISKDSLTISGEKREQHERRERNVYYAERSYGAFSRSIPLPPGIETDNADASFTKGVLTVKLPKTAQTEGRRSIPIRTGDRKSVV